MNTVDMTSCAGHESERYDEINDGTKEPDGHIEARNFSAPGQETAAVNSHGVPTLNLVFVRPDGSIDQDIRMVPGKGEAKTPEDILAQSGDELLKKFRAGDESLFKALRGTDGATLLFKIQTAAQDENRMFTLLSGIQSTDHDTKKTIISNMRA